MNKKLTNQEIKDRCKSMIILEEPSITDGNGDIWVTPNTLASIFNKTISWAYGLARKHCFLKKKEEGKALYRYLDFYEATNRRSWK